MHLVGGAVWRFAMQEKVQEKTEDLKTEAVSEKKPNPLLEKIKEIFAGLKAKIAGLRKPKDDKAEAAKSGADGAESDGAAEAGELTLEDIPELYLPETTEDLVWLLKKLPEEVLTKDDKKLLAKSMSFSSKRVREIMIPKEEVIFVHENDFMGPLTLDRLYKSGLEHFPVVDTKGGIAGVLHTSSLNSLEVRETDRASSYLDKTVYYVRDNYTLPEALAAFTRTNSYFFVVVNQGAQMVGLLTLAALMEALIGEMPKDDFGQDTDLMAVAKRGMSANSYYGSFKPEYRPGTPEYRPGAFRNHPESPEPRPIAETGA